MIHEWSRHCLLDIYPILLCLDAIILAQPRAVRLIAHCRALGNWTRSAMHAAIKPVNSPCTWRWIVQCSKLNLLGGFGADEVVCGAAIMSGTRVWLVGYSKNGFFGGILEWESLMYTCILSVLLYCFIRLTDRTALQRDAVKVTNFCLLHD